jgi:hypothetical protein
MAKPSKTTCFKRQNRRYFLPMAKLSTPVVFKWYIQPSTSTVFKWQNHPKPLVLNGKIVDTYFLQMAKLSTPVVFKWYIQPSTSTVFKWQNWRKLLSSNDKAVGTYGKTVITSCLQTAELSRLLFSSDKIFDIYCLHVAKLRYLFSSKDSTVDAYSLRTAILLTSSVFKWQYRTTLGLMSSNGNAIDTYTLQMTIT